MNDHVSVGVVPYEPESSLARQNYRLEDVAWHFTLWISPGLDYAASRVNSRLIELLFVVSGDVQEEISEIVDDLVTNYNAHYAATRDPADEVVVDVRVFDDVSEVDWSDPSWRGVYGTVGVEECVVGGYFRSDDDAEAVLSAFRDGSGVVLGATPRGSVVMRVDSVTGFRKNPAAGVFGEPTSVFFLVGDDGGMVVPAHPGWTKPTAALPVASELEEYRHWARYVLYQVREACLGLLGQEVFSVKQRLGLGSVQLLFLVAGEMTTDFDQICDRLDVLLDGQVDITFELYYDHDFVDFTNPAIHNVLARYIETYAGRDAIGWDD